MKQEHFDARLTDFGNEQCAALKATGHGIEKEAQLVVVSPLTRAIETAIRTVDQVCIRVHDSTRETSTWSEPHIYIYIYRCNLAHSNVELGEQRFLRNFL